MASQESPLSIRTLSPCKALSPLSAWKSNLPVELQSSKSPPSRKKIPSRAQSAPNLTRKEQAFVRPPPDNMSPQKMILNKSVREGDLAKCTVGDSEKKIHMKVEKFSNGNFSQIYNKLRKELLVKAHPTDLQKIKYEKKVSKEKLNQSKSKELPLVDKAIVAFSPLNSDNKSSNNIALMKKNRQLKLEGGVDDMNGEDELSVILNDPTSYIRKSEEEKEQVTDKKSKYIVDNNSPSPFTCAPESCIPHSKAKSSSDLSEVAVKRPTVSGGLNENLPIRERLHKAQIKNARYLRQKNLRKELKAAAAVHVIELQSSHDKLTSDKNKIINTQEKIVGKLPGRLRKTVEDKYNIMMTADTSRHSGALWLKAKDNRRKEMEAEDLDYQYDTTSHQLLRQQKGAEGNMQFDSSAFELDLISGDEILYSLEREGLFTVDDLEDLNSEHSDDLLENASETDLFHTLDLLELDVDRDDPLLSQERLMTTPEGVLSTSMGTLLFSQMKQKVSTRPASAGLGGVSQASLHRAHKSPQKQDHYAYHSMYNLDIRRRPRSANTAPHVRSSGDFEKLNEVPNYVNKKRLVINRFQTPTDWIS